jgi:RsiW-degrading membrane proteinase PrsW (M82 family)
MKLSVRIETGTLAGKSFELTKGTLIFGRSERCNVRFDPFAERIISKEHCLIEAKNDGFYLTDNQSTNGTFLNGERIQTAMLKPGDVIQLGRDGVKCQVQIEDLFAGEQIRITPNSQIPTAIRFQDAESEQTRIKPRLSQPEQNKNIESQSEQTRLSPNLPLLGQLPAEIHQFQPLQSPVASLGEEKHQLNAPMQMFSPGSSINFKNSLSGLGGGAIPQKYQPEPAKNNTAKYFGIGLGILGLLFCFLLVLAITFLQVGPITAFVATFVAFTPAIFYILPFILLDRYDPEPFWLLALAFAWGALVSVVFSFFANTIFGVGVSLATDSLIGDSLTAVIAAPIFEEGSKGAGLLLLLIFFRKYFDDILDGIVFGGVIALGFATVENILYYGRAINAGGLVGLIFLFLLRGVLSPFAHAAFTSMTGIGCGIARETHNAAIKIIFPVLGYIMAVLLHALWNGMAVFAGYIVKGFNIGWACESIALGGNLQGFCAFLLGYAFLQVPLFLGFVGFAIFVLRRQNKILREMLAIDVARGLIPQDHMLKATSIHRSIIWLTEGIFKGKFKARNKYLRSISKLGLSYWHIQRATEAQGQTASFQQNPILREEVQKWQKEI